MSFCTNEFELVRRTHDESAIGLARPQRAASCKGL